MPACTIDPIGAISSPLSPLVIAPVGKTFTRAHSLTRSVIQVIVLALSAGGSVFGMQTIEEKPPAAAARVPVSIVSLWDCPGSRK